MDKPKYPDLPPRSGMPTSEKAVLTLRMPPDMGMWLAREAQERGWSLNEFVVTLLNDHFTWFELPQMVTPKLDADQSALGLDRSTYIQHVLMQRYHLVRENGPGFDKAEIHHGGKTSK